MYRPLLNVIWVNGKKNLPVLRLKKKNNYYIYKGVDWVSMKLRINVEHNVVKGFL